MRKYLILFSLSIFCSIGAKAQCSSTSYGGGWVCDETVRFFQNSNNGIASITTLIFTAAPNDSLIIAQSASCASTTCTVARNQQITITDNGGANSYICPTNNPQVNFSGTIIGATTCYVCKSAGLPTQWTATNSDTINGAFTRILVTVWHNTNGTMSSSCLDQQSTATFTTGTGTTAAIATTSNTTGNNDLIFSTLFILATFGQNNGFTFVAQDNSLNLNAAAKNGATPGSYPTGWTFSSNPWYGDELSFFNPVPFSGVPRKHGTFIKHRSPWVIKRNELRIETI